MCVFLDFDLELDLLDTIAFRKKDLTDSERILLVRLTLTTVHLSSTRFSERYVTLSDRKLEAWEKAEKIAAPEAYAMEADEVSKLWETKLSIWMIALNNPMGIGHGLISGFANVS